MAESVGYLDSIIGADPYTGLDPTWAALRARLTGSPNLVAQGGVAPVAGLVANPQPETTGNRGGDPIDRVVMGMLDRMFPPAQRASLGALVSGVSVPDVGAGAQAAPAANAAPMSAAGAGADSPMTPVAQDAAAGAVAGIHPAQTWQPPASLPGILNGQIPLPTPRPAEAALPPAAVPAAGVAPPSMPIPSPPVVSPPAIPETSLAGRAPSFLDKLGTGINNSANTLIAMGAGFAGAPSIGTGISRALTGAQQGQQLDRQLQNQNSTAAFLAARIPGLSQEQAVAMAASPEIMKQILPAVIGSKELGNANGVLFDKATGRVVADLSEGQKWQIGTVKNPKTGEDQTVLIQPATGKVRAINPTDLTRTSGQGGAASENISIPPQARLLPPAEQYRQAPDDSTATLGGRPVIKRNGRWEYQ